MNGVFFSWFFWLCFKFEGIATGEQFVAADGLVFLSLIQLELEVSFPFPLPIEFQVGRFEGEFC
jgi:hypothetical protein